VTVACGPAELGGRPAVRVSVRDDGPGLTEEQRRRVFEPFFTTKVKGTGLGLAIVKRIVEAHGGTVAVGDAPGGGAEVVFTLPRGTS
jgi:signal transduction histidine kinase